MKKAIEFLMHQKLLIGLLILLILLGGFMTARRMNREAFPEVNFDMVSIRTIYPGGSPDDLEQLVTIPIEKKLRVVDGLDKVRSYNIENVSVVVAYIDDKAPNKKNIVRDIRDAVDLVENLPQGTHTPIVEEITTDTMPAIDIAVYGKTENVTYRQLRETADELEDFLYDIEGVAEVESFGLLDQEYLVEVDPDALQRRRIGMNTVINTLKNRNVDLPGGSLRVGDTEYVLRTKGQFRSAEEIRNSVIMSNDMGYITRIRDVAKVTDAYAEPDVLERFNGHEAVVLRVWRQSSADEIRLVNRLKNEVASFRPAVNNGISLSVFNDMSRFTRESIDRVTSNAVFGFILLALIMMLLMGWRMSGLVTACIPVIFMVAIIGMKMLGITFNVISLFSMVMVLGMIVDFGIVVSENTHRYMEMGCEKTDAIIRGVQEVFWPVTVTLMCLCAAFSPLLLLSGLMGKFIFGIPAVLIICLVASWFIAMFVMPTMLNMFTRSHGTEACDDELHREDPNYERGFFGAFQRKYKIFLAWSLHHRYITMLVLVVLLVLSQVMGSRLGFVFSPVGGEEQITVRATLPQESNLQANLREMRKIESIIAKLPKKELDNFQATVGKRVTSALDPVPGEATHKSTIVINLSSAEKRERTADAIVAGAPEPKFLRARRRVILTKTYSSNMTCTGRGPPWECRSMWRFAGRSSRS